MTTPDHTAGERTAEVVTVTPNPALDWTLTIPQFTAGSVNRVVSHRLTPGGKGVNVAAALARHGHRVAATGLLGAVNAEPFETLFAGLGIDDAFVRVAGETRVGIKIADPTHERTTDVNFAGARTLPDDVAALRARVAALATESTRWFVLAGSLPPGIDASFHGELTRTLVATGRHVVVDTSGDALRYAVGARPAVVKPNIHELEALVGEPLPTIEHVLAAARALGAGGIDLVVVSMGEEGALFVEPREAVIARPPGVIVRSTVGAGDAMVAGIVAGRLRGLPLAELARLATAFSLAAITAGGRGPDDQAPIGTLGARVTIDRVG